MERTIKKKKIKVVKVRKKIKRKEIETYYHTPDKQ